MADNKKTVLITGCSPGGIGNALAREFHKKGLRVFATARSTNTIKDLNDLGIETLSLEVNETDSVGRCKEQISALTGGRLDYLVNNAGRNYTIPALDIELSEAVDTFQINVISVMYIVQVFSPLLIASRGTIVQIGSIAGILPYVFSSVYNASKAALLAYSNTLRVELEPFGVKVVTIVTGGVKSRIARVQGNLPPRSLYKPIESSYVRRVTHSQEGAMDTRVYAKRVVDRVLGLDSWMTWLLMRNRKLVWEGNMARTVWCLYTFFWEGFMDGILKRTFGLRNLQRKKSD